MDIPRDLIDPFHRELSKRLMDLMVSRMENLSAGSAKALPEDSSTVAEKYAAQVSYIQAIKDILNVCHDIEVERYGPQPSISLG